MSKQTFQFDIEWQAGDKDFTLEEMKELLEECIGSDYDNLIENVKEIK